MEGTAPIGKAWRAGCDASFAFPYASSSKTQAAMATAPAGSGAYQVALGSFSVPGNAQAAADRLDHGFGEALAGRHPAIHATTVNGRAYSVVTVAAFATAGDASDFCARIRASKLECAVRKLGGKPG